MEIKTKATEILDKHLGHEQIKYLFENNEPLWDDIVDAVNEALNIPIVSDSFVYLQTIGDGTDGNEWQVIGMYNNYNKAYRAKKKYKFSSSIERWRID